MGKMAAMGVKAARYLREHPHITIKAMCEAHNWPYHTCRRWLQTAEAQAIRPSRRTLAQEGGAREGILRLPLEDRGIDAGLFRNHIGQHETVTGDWVIIGDVHAPTTDLEMAGWVAEMARRTGVRQLLIAGDLLNLDALSYYAPTLVPDPLELELQAAEALLRSWLRTFERVLVLAGNHEERLARALFGQLGTRRLLASILQDDRLEVSEFRYCVIDTPQGAWRITHPGNYSRIPLRTANQLAAKHQQHIWSFHEHHFGVTWSDSGRYLLVNGGGLFEPGHIAYVSRVDRTSPRMVKGFGVLEGGYPTLYSEAPYTNWGALGLSRHKEAA